MHARIAALALALLTAIGCDSEEVAPAEGSCQALVDEIVELDDCRPALGNGKTFDYGPGDPDESAGCAAEVFDLDAPPDGVIEGEAYQVAYAALCQLHGNTAADFCTISESIGCDP